MVFFQAEDGIRDAQESRGLGDVYKRQNQCNSFSEESIYDNDQEVIGALKKWTSCSNNTEINYWILFNQGHEWNEGDKDGSSSFDTSQTIWNFFKQFDLNGLKN